MERQRTAFDTATAATPSLFGYAAYSTRRWRMTSLDPMEQLHATGMKQWTLGRALPAQTSTTIHRFEDVCC